MNEKQRNFVLKRIEEILQRKRKELEEKLRAKNDDAVEIDRAKLIRSGKVKLRADITEIGSYDMVINAFDFSKFEKPKFDIRKEVEKQFRPIEKRAGKLSDLIMFGTSEADALKKLTEFDEERI